MLILAALHACIAVILFVELVNKSYKTLTVSSWPQRALILVLCAFVALVWPITALVSLIRRIQ